MSNALLLRSSSIVLLALCACIPGGRAADTLACGEGTREQNGECVAGLACGDGTVQTDSVCVGAIACGEGTVEQQGWCRTASTLSCGAGTRASGGQCLVDASACGSNTRLSGGRCVGTDPSAVCGTDTDWNGTRCVGSVLCGTGTSRSGDVCVASSAACGQNTSFVNGQCVASASMTCGANTTATGNRCEVAAGACGAGTTFQNGRCVASAPGVTCGGGTVLSGSTCVPAPAGGTISQFIAGTTIPAYEEARGQEVIGYNWISEPVYGLCVHPKFAVSTASATQSRALLNSSAPVIGQHSMITVWTSPRMCDSSTTRFPAFTETYSVVAPADCAAAIGTITRRPAGTGAYVTFAKWSGGAVAQAVCATAGSVSFQTNATNRTVIVTVNVQFSDGSTVTDRWWSDSWSS